MRRGFRFSDGKWARVIIGGALVAGMIAASSIAGCFNPNPQDGAFKCDSADNYLCPQGLTCDRSSGLCLHILADDMTIRSLGGGNADGGASSLPMCDQLVRAGSFSNPTLLAISTAGDDTHVSVSSDGTQLVFSAGGTPTLASIGADPHSVTKAQALTLSGAPAGLAFSGGAFGKDGSFWLAGATTAGAVTTSQLYASTLAGTTLTIGTAHSPTAKCASSLLSDPTFVAFDPTGELLATGPLAGCTSGSWVVTGVVDRDFGGFVAAVGASGFAGPAITPSGLTLLAANTGSGSVIHVSTRAAVDSQFTGNDVVPQGSALGIGTRDAQLIIHPSCAVAYLVSQRAGGSGGLDLWTLDIGP